jgi:hypothetical protein
MVRCGDPIGYRLSESAPYHTEPDSVEESQLAAGHEAWVNKPSTKGVRQPKFTALSAVTNKALQLRPASKSQIFGPGSGQEVREQGAFLEEGAQTLDGRPLRQADKPERTAWQKGQRVGATGRVTAGAGRDAICLLKEAKARPKAGRPKVAEHAPWARAQRAGEEGVHAELAQAWGAAAAAREPAAGEGWRFVATGGDGARSNGRYGQSSKASRPVGCEGRGPLAHVGDDIRSDVAQAARSDFGWGFATQSEEGPGHGEHYNTRGRRPAPTAGAAGQPSGMGHPEGSHAMAGPLSAERGLYKFQGREPAEYKKERRQKELKTAPEFAEQAVAAASGPEQAWQASIKPLPDDTPADWVRRKPRPTRREAARPKVDATLQRRKEPKPGWLKVAETRRGSKAKAAVTRKDHAVVTSPAPTRTLLHALPALDGAQCGDGGMPCWTGC